MNATIAPDRLVATLAHRCAGRARLALVGPLPDRERLTELADAASGIAGLTSIEIRLVTGSIILKHEGAFEPIQAALAAEAGLIVLPKPPAMPFDPVIAAASQLSALDSGMRKVTGEGVDLRKTLFMGLIAAGLVQVARGRIAGPALTLFGQAVTVAMSWPARNQAGVSPPARPGPKP